MDAQETHVQHADHIAEVDASSLELNVFMKTILFKGIVFIYINFSKLFTTMLCCKSDRKRRLDIYKDK